MNATRHAAQPVLAGSGRIGLGRPVGATRSERELTGRESVWLHVAAVVTYVPLGVLLRTPLLNWIVGPMYLVLVVWLVPPLLDRVRGRR